MKTKSIIIKTIACALLLASCNPKSQEKDVVKSLDKPPKRVGMVVKLKADKVDEYKKLHADNHPGVRDLLQKYNLHNFNIFIHQLEDGQYYEFGYYEYTGEDFENDMRLLSNEPRNKEWISICAPMQVPLEGYNDWAQMEQVYYNK